MSEELKQKLIERAVECLDNPFENWTVKDVANDLLLGLNKAQEVFRRAWLSSGQNRKNGYGNKNSLHIMEIGKEGRIIKWLIGGAMEKAV